MKTETATATVTATATLNWVDLRHLGHTDRAGRYYPDDAVCQEYVGGWNYRSPSAAHPLSHARPLLTEKFAKWARQAHPEWAAKHGLV